MNRKLILGLALSVSVGAFAAQESIWTDWAQKPTILGLLKLMKIRDGLGEDNLFYFADLSKTEVRKCTTEDKIYRSADGACNDETYPAMGASNAVFGRNVPEKFTYPDEKNIMNPNPRTISLELLTRKKFKPLSNLNLLGVAWVQFMVHDWVNHENRSYDSESLFEIPLGENDPSGQSVMYVPKTKANEDYHTHKTQAPLYNNTATHWWDGSQLYGNNFETQSKIRSFRDGKLKVTAQNTIDVDSDGIEVTGVTANWWLGLSLMHNLFVQEHNTIAEQLKAKYPSWDDQKLFNTARLINSALMAKIQTLEWTPTLHKGNKVIKMGQGAQWNGFFGMGAKLKGIVGGQRDYKGVPFSLTEEFVSVYRLHSFLPESITITSLKNGAKVEMPVKNMRNENSHKITASMPMSDLLYSFGSAKAGEQKLANYPNFMQNLAMPVIGSMDLGAVDIIRDRERGVPRYNNFRRLLKLNPITKFEDLTSDKETVAKLKRLYNNDVEMLDLMVGSLAEETRPENLGFGETFFQVFLVMTPRRLEADRFFTTDYRKEIYTQFGLDWVKNNDMKSIITRHYPSLGNKLPKDESPFYPWN